MIMYEKAVVAENSTEKLENGTPIRVWNLIFFTSPAYF